MYSTDGLSPSAPEGAISQAAKESARSAANPAKIIFFIKNSVSLFFEGHTVLPVLSIVFFSLVFKR
jgi:hypothetical protein